MRIAPVQDGQAQDPVYFTTNIYRQTTRKLLHGKHARERECEHIYYQPCKYSLDESSSASTYLYNYYRSNLHPARTQQTNIYRCEIDKDIRIRHPCPVVMRAMIRNTASHITLHPRANSGVIMHAGKRMQETQVYPQICGLHKNLLEVESSSISTWQYVLHRPIFNPVWKCDIHRYRYCVANIHFL